MPRLKTTALSLLCSAALLSGCARPAPDIRLIDRAFPPALTRCAAAPVPPGSAEGQRAVALFLLSLAAAHRDCRAKLAALARIAAAPTGESLPAP